jgi:hypothetical protein
LKPAAEDIYTQFLNDSIRCIQDRSARAEMLAKHKLIVYIYIAVGMSHSDNYISGAAMDIYGVLLSIR